MHRERVLRHPDLASALGGAAIAVGSVVALLAARPSASSVLVAAIAVLSIVPVVVRVVQGRFDPFEPIFVFSLAWIGMFVVRPLAMIHYNEFSYIWAPGVSLRGTFDRMLLLAFLGGIAFLLGYALPTGPSLAARAPHPPTQADPRLLTVIALITAGVGLLLFGLFVIQVGPSNIRTILGGQSLASLSVIGRSNKYLVLGPLLLVGSTLVTFAIAITTRRRGLLVTALGLIVVTWLIWSTFGSRTVMFPLFAAIGIFYYLARDRRPRAFTVALALLIAVFASAVVVDSRYAVTRQQEGMIAVADRVVSHPSEILSPLLRGTDNAMAPGLAAAMTIVPSHHSYDYGWAFLRDLLTRPVPRSIWPSKPLPPREALVKSLNPTGYQNHTANPEASNLLVPYLSWGMFGAAFLVFYGIGARFIYEWFKLYRGEVAAQLLFALLLPLSLTAVRDSIVDYFAYAALMTVPVWLVFTAGKIRARS